jgi:hypothetical protein
LDKAKENGVCDSSDRNDGCIDGLECINNKCVIQGQCNADLQNQAFYNETDLRKNSLCNKRVGNEIVSITTKDNIFSWTCNGTNKENDSKLCTSKQKVKDTCKVLPTTVKTYNDLVNTPKENLCTLGQVDFNQIIPFDETTGTFKWRCLGINGADIIICSGKKTGTAVNGMCNSGTDCATGNCIGNKCVSKDSTCNGTDSLNNGCKSAYEECQNTGTSSDGPIYKCMVSGICGGAKGQTFKNEDDLRKSEMCKSRAGNNKLEVKLNVNVFEWTCDGSITDMDDKCTASLDVTNNNSNETPSNGNLFNQLMCNLFGINCVATSETLPEGQTNNTDVSENEEENPTDDTNTTLPDNTGMTSSSTETTETPVLSPSPTSVPTSSAVNSKISFKIAFTGVKPNAVCLQNSGLRLMLKVNNLTSNKSQDLNNVNFGLGEINSSGEQIFVVNGLNLNNKFNNVDKNNLIRIKTTNGLFKAMCINNQNSYRIKNCSLDLTQKDSFVYNFAGYELVLGDINSDGVIDSTDYSLIKSKVSESKEIKCGSKEDINLDGLVNDEDLELLVKRIGLVSD